jgi:hypothetical protein
MALDRTAGRQLRAQVSTRRHTVPLPGAARCYRQRALINWSYAIADASVRHGYLHDALPPAGRPYPGGVGGA